MTIACSTLSVSGDEKAGAGQAGSGKKSRGRGKILLVLRRLFRSSPLTKSLEQAKMTIGIQPQLIEGNG